MKIIRISTKNEISLHDYPAGTYNEQNKALRDLIGPRCELYEHVMPKRLYTELGGSRKISTEKGECVSMLIDEEGHYHDLEMNLVGSYLYEMEKHGCVIVGNILIVGEVWSGDGIDFCGISDSQFESLYHKLKTLTEEARRVS